MKVTVLGAGSWGLCLANLLASKNYNVNVWSRHPATLEAVVATGSHPKLGDIPYASKLKPHSDLATAVDGTQMIVESVSSQGIRPVAQQLVRLKPKHCPLVVTSKGIEQGSGLLFPEILLEVLGADWKPWISCLSGPSHAEEVLRRLPTTVVGSAYDEAAMQFICKAFTTNEFRVYPNPDINGVAFGGAMKNPMAIACGICDAIGLGDNTKAALMTRGLHEMRKLSIVKACNPETLNGLSGMGDLSVTCLSTHSRNYRFGRLLGEGLSREEALASVGMVVEGVYTCIAALELGRQAGIELPITQGIHAILYEGKKAQEVVKELMQRNIKEEFQ